MVTQAILHYGQLRPVRGVLAGRFEAQKFAHPSGVLEISRNVRKSGCHDIGKLAQLGGAGIHSGHSFCRCRPGAADRKTDAAKQHSTEGPGCSRSVPARCQSVSGPSFCQAFVAAQIVALA